MLFAKGLYIVRWLQFLQFPFSPFHYRRGGRCSLVLIYLHYLTLGWFLFLNAESILKLIALGSDSIRRKVSLLYSRLTLNTSVTSMWGVCLTLNNSPALGTPAGSDTMSGISIRYQQLRAQSHKTAPAPTSDTNSKSRHHLGFLYTVCKLEVLITPSSGLINLLEQFRELRKPVCLLG